MGQRYNVRKKQSCLQTQPAYVGLHGQNSAATKAFLCTNRDETVINDEITRELKEEVITQICLSMVPCGEVSKEDGVIITADLDNKGKIYLSKTSPKSVHKAYALQFQSDFLVFLRSRSEEVVPGGRMVLSLLGRSSLDPTTEESCYQWELLAQALMSMANEGIIEEEKIDAFNAPYYAASSEELKMVIEKEGSFLIDRLEVSPVNWEGGSVTEENYDILRSKPEALASGRRVAKTIRAVIEPMLEPTFGHNVMDELFERYAKIVGEYSYVSSPRYAIVNISLVKMG